jgi:aspartyl-tRNA(Asn)/glutamyl-tRNA(Gln) amidotransferase subunit A
MDQQVQQDYARALDRLSQAGAELIEVRWPEFDEIADIHAPAGFSAIECWATHKPLLQNGMTQLDPRVATRLRAGIEVSAADYLTMRQRRADWIERTRCRLHGFDAWCSPTVPVVAPEIAPLMADDAAFMAANRLSLRNTFVSNFLDGCSISLPMQAPGHLPTGLMLSSVGGDDAGLLDLADLAESVIRD